MLSIQSGYPLKALNTFGMDVTAAYYSELKGEEEVTSLHQNSAIDNGLLLLGGGSNILFTENVAQWVIHNKIKGIEKVKENEQHVWLRVGAGEIWHDFVLHCVHHGFAGVENLSLIPGTVGATPIQNIGAYGVEVKEIIEEVKFWHIVSKKFNVFNNNDCHFGYRDSVFKQELKGQIIITSVLFRLNKKPIFHISYGNLQQELDNMGVKQLSIEQIAKAVMQIRRSKLPDPKVIGNAGSFFKNPETDIQKYHSLKLLYPTIPGYPVSEQSVKIPAGWLIEQCGWKGFRKDDYGVHKNQALVLVNYGNANGNDIAVLSEQIIQSVVEKFDIILEREVQIV